MQLSIKQTNKSNIWSGWLLFGPLIFGFLLPESSGLHKWNVSVPGFCCFFCGLAGRIFIRHTKHLDDKKKNKKGGQ